MVAAKLAQTYLSKGWSVIPVHAVVREGRCTCGNEACTSPGKHPRIAWKEYTRRLPTREEVSIWFDDEFRGANVGLVTGSVSNIVVVDLDVRHGAEVIRARLKLPRRTLIARTGGRGTHLFYQMNGYEIPSRVRAFPNVDIKAENGFVVLPPSNHKSGNVYRWITSFDPAVADLSVLIPKPTERMIQEDWYAELLEGVEKGFRHSVAVRLAGRYVTIGLSIREAETLMVAWNEKNNPPLPDSELKTVIKSLYTKHTVDKKEVARIAKELRKEENSHGKRSNA